MGSPVANPWRVLGLAVLAQFGVSVVDQGLPTLTGFVKAELGVSASVAGLAVSSFAFGKIFGSYAAGVAADRFGERRVIAAGAMAVAALVACAAAAPEALLFVLLAAAGLAASTSTPAGGRLVLLAFPRSRHGVALSLRQCAIPLGGLVAAALLPWVAHLSSWRWSLVVAGSVTLASVLPLVLSSRARADEPATQPAPAARGNPIRDRNIRLLTLWGCLVVSGQYVILAFLALDLHRNARLSLASASLLVSLANAFGIAGRICWGSLSDRALAHGRKPLLLVLNAAGLAAAVALLATPRSAPITVFAVLAAFAGFALIGYQGLFITMLAELAGARRVGAATGLALTFVQASIALTPPLYGLVADVTGNYRSTWAALVCVLAVAFVPAVLLREPDTAAHAPG